MNAGPGDPAAVESPESGPSRTHAARGALWLSASSWSGKGMQTVVLLVLAKVLVPSEFGILAIAAMTYNLIQSLNNLGLTGALTQRKDRAHEAARTATTIVLLGGLGLFAVTWAVAPAIASFFHSPGATFVVRGFAISIPFDAASVVPIALLTRALKFPRRTVTDAVPTVVGGLVTVVVVSLGHPLGGLVAGQIVTGVVNCAVALSVGYRCWPGWDRRLASELIRYGGYLCLADIVTLALLNVDYLVVGHRLGPVALGLYSLAYRIAYMPYLAVAYVGNGAAFPYYCRLASPQAVARAAERVFSLLSILVVPLYAGMIIFAPDVVLLGHKWAPAVGAIRLLAIYGFFFSLILTAQQPLKAVGKTRPVLEHRALHLAILAGVLVATASSGITIVALDQAVIAAGIALFALWQCVHFASLSPRAIARAVALPLLGAAAMAAVALPLRLLGPFASQSWISFCSLGVLSVLAFAAVARVLSYETIRQGWAALRGERHDFPFVATGSA